MKVWISRSRPGADRQAADLRGAGHDVVVAPVIDIEPVKAPFPRGAFDHVVFLSEHAVRCGLATLKTQRWFAAARVLAVGERTAETLRDQHVDAETPSEPTSEGLLALPGLRRLGGRRVLLAAGAGGRSLLARELRARGAAVERFECYRRVVARRPDAAALGCEVIIAASGEGLVEVARVWLEAGGRPDVPVLVPSRRVAALGVEVGLSNLHDCAGADSDAWLRGLAQLQSAGKS